MIIFLITYWVSQWLDDVFPNVDLSSLFGSIESISVFVKFAGYFLPMSTLTILFGITFLLISFVVISNLIKLIWDIIPFA